MKNSIRVFHKHTKSVIMAIMASEALLRKNKKPSNKMSPKAVLDLGPQPFRSNALFSELSRNVLLGVSLNFLLLLHHYNLGFWSFS